MKAVMLLDKILEYNAIPAEPFNPSDADAAARNLLNSVFPERLKPSRRYIEKRKAFSKTFMFLLSGEYIVFEKAPVLQCLHLRVSKAGIEYLEKHRRETRDKWASFGFTALGIVLGAVLSLTTTLLTKLLL